MHRVARNMAHFHLVTLWDDVDDIKLGFEQLLIKENGQIQDFCVCAACSPDRQTECPEVGGGNLIARLWRGIVPMHKAEAYLAYLSGFGFPDYEAYAGFRGAHLLRRTENATVQIVFLSFWDSWQSIVAYAGPDPRKAHYYAYDLECLIDPAPSVEHYEVLGREPGEVPTAGSLCELS